jgi:hypothetical protein
VSILGVIDLEEGNTTVLLDVFDYLPLDKAWYSRRLAVLGALAKLRKLTVSFVVSVCLSVRIEQLGSHWKDFYEI